MSKVPLADQIAMLEVVAAHAEEPALDAALSTLKWVEKHLAELRVLGEFPGSRIEIVTPQATGLSAIAQERDEGGSDGP